MAQKKCSLFPNITLDEFRVMAIVCRDDGNTKVETLEYINCINDLLGIQKSAVMINKRRGNTVRRRTMRDVLVGRIMQMNVPDRDTETTSATTNNPKK